MRKLVMFSKHTRYSKAAYWLMAINTVIGIATLVVLLYAFSNDSADAITAGVLLAILGGMLILCIYLAYRVYKRSTRALHACLWLYALQINSFESENLSIYLNTGIQLTISWSFRDVSVAINLAAMMIWIVIFKAYRSIAPASD